MRISSIHIRQYKSFLVPFRLEQPGTLHIFIGPNNAGKTNILDAISQLYQVNPGRLQSAQADLEMSFTLFGESQRQLHVIQRGTKKTFSIGSRVITGERGKEILAKHIMRISALYAPSVLELQKVYESFRKNYPHRFGAFQKSIALHFPTIKLSRDFFKHSVVHEGGVDRTYERLGAGFQQVFIILLYFYHPQYSIILLEEPEIHLHPALVKRLFRVIERDNEGTQIFLTTHSPLLIKPTNLHRVFRVTRDSVSTRVHSPRLAGKRVDYNRLKQELNADNLEMFFADTVLLVEGPSDHLLMRGLIDRFYRGTKEIKVIQTYGKSNMEVYADILSIFDVPYAMLLDRDALYDTGALLLEKYHAGSITESEAVLIQKLKKYRVFVLPNGSIEKNYPRKYQRLRKHKPQNALYAVSHMTESEYRSAKMKYLREVIQSL